MIQGFWHVSFTVRDLDAAVKWYTEVLGLEYVRGQVQQNEYTSKLVAYPDAHLKVAQLRVPGMTIPQSRHHIELVEYLNPRGEDIPLEARIVTVADVFDALISPRPYKRAWSAMEAIDYVREQSGRMLDPDCVEALLQNLPRLYEICDRYSTGAVKAAQE